MNTINNKNLSALLLVVSFFANGCGYMLAPKYDQPIYTYKKPYVSVQLTYGEIHIIAPIILENALPDYFEFQVIRASDHSPIFSGTQYIIGDPIEVYLPQNSLPIDVNGNILILTPIGRNYKSVEIKFTGVRYGDILLPTTIIKKRPAIVRGVVTKRFDGSSIDNLHIEIIDSLGHKFVEKTNKNGEYEFKLPNEYYYYNNLKIYAGASSPFHISQQNIDFMGKFSTVVNLSIGPSKEFMEEGNFYIVKDDRTHYRSEPFNGSKTQFMLDNNELVSVSRVAGNRLLGQVEVFYDNHKSVFITGWINANEVVWIGDINLYLSGNEDEIQ
jgi:hypothetical protein|tara:strand:+ start:131 stop:1114 length:984 start_codon:yes stop_codon:yes gene_type:complete